MKKTLSYYIAALRRSAQLLSAPALTADPEVDTLTYDTRTLSGASLFICKGAHFKEEYLRFAAEHGAVAYVSETAYPVELPCILVRDIRFAMPILAKLHFDAADEKLCKLGITGTKGKSTTAYFVRAILDKYMQRVGGRPCAVLSSIDNYDGETLEESHLTTPESVELFRHFAAAVRSGITHLVMEASSQGLKYDRLDGVTFEAAAFLNVGKDHISPIEHPDFADYFASKLKIFDHCRKAVLNYDIPQREEALAYINGRVPVITFGRTEGADVWGHDLRKTGDGFSFIADFEGKSEPFSICIPGIFNVDNALAAIALCRAAGIPAEDIRAGLAVAKVSGRMEVYGSKDGRVTVIVDYAHNKMSFEALFDSVRREYPDRSIVAVYGCPGGKAQGRREDLPEVSGKYSSCVIVTEEDSGEEPFEKIAADITSHLPESTPRRVIPDRGEAIKEAILDLGQDSVILVTGKGEETRQKRGTLYIDCPSDVDYTKQYLEQYDKKQEAKV